MTHLSDGTSEKCVALYTCMINISQHGSGARALKDHESLGGGRTWSAPRLTSMETVMRGWIGEARVEDQPQVERLQQMRGAEAGAAVRQPASNLLDARQGKPPVFRGEETKWQEWYFKFRAYIVCSGDRHPDLVTAIEDPTQRPMDTTRWDAEQIQVSRHLYLILVMLTEEPALRIVQAVQDSNGAEALRLLHRMYHLLTQGRMSANLNEVLQIDLGTDERKYTRNVARQGKGQRWQEQG